MNKKETKNTILYDSHVHLGAKLVPFAGYMMPVAYSEGIQSEYFSIRENVGLFDVSHMGEFYIYGEHATKFLDYLTLNNVSKLKIGDAQYSAMCNNEGGIIDDLILYKKNNGYLMVVNASNITKNYDWVCKNIIKGVKIDNLSNKLSLIALQGPSSRDILSKLTKINLHLPFYSFKEGLIHQYQVMLSRTGYTGELGFEIYGDDNSILNIWNRLIDYGVKPAGLAARDILRMEMKYCLYGNDINNTTNPLEAGIGWIIDFSKNNFIGREALIKTKTKGISKNLVAFLMEERGIPRKGYEIFVEDKKIGEVTSGTQSPLLKKGIGLGYIKIPYNKINQQIFICIRNKLIKAKIIKAPFIKSASLYD